ASPWMRSFQRPNTARISHVRLSGGATLEISRAASARCVSVLLVTDIGTTPVSRYLPMVRRLAELRRVVPNWEPVLFVVTLDPGGTSARLQAWRSLVARAAHHGSLDARFATWDDLGKAAPSVRMPRPGSLAVCSATSNAGPDLGRSSENQ